jgi:hypothetical protein
MHTRKAGGKPIDIGKVRITDVGRRAIEGNPGEVRSALRSISRSITWIDRVALRTVLRRNANSLLLRVRFKT